MKSLPKSLTSLTSQEAQIHPIPLNKIRESVVTLRTEYDNESLDELGDSLTDRGQLQTLVVQPGDGDTYDLVIGSRRLRAAKRKRMKDLAAYVISKRHPVELLFIALAENLHRADLNPFEEAQAFLRLMKEYNLTTKSIAKGVNKGEQYVRRRLQLLSMPEEVATMVAESKLGLQHIPPLARLPSGEAQVRLAETAVANRLTESELRAEVSAELKEPKPVQRSSPHSLTPIKVKARADEFADWLNKVPRRMSLRRMNSAEKSNLLESLRTLEDAVRSLRATVQTVASVSSETSATRRGGNIQSKRNHGEEWTSRDIRRITARDRTSDEELAEELGRTPTAIRAMRAQVREKQKA